MGSRHADKIWAVGGVLGAAALLAVGWFFFIGPKYQETASLRDQVVQAELRLTSAQRTLSDLRQQNEKLPQYQDELRRLHQALPATPESSNFLRQLQAAGETAGVTVTGLTIGARAEIPGTEGAVYALAVSLTVVGKDDRLESFLSQLQQVQPRAVLIQNANTTADNSGPMTLTLNLEVFVAPVKVDAPATPAPAK
jgi:Tfp pilus assembly protein PilO